MNERFSFFSSFCRLEARKVKTLGYIRGLILGPFFVSAKLISLVVFVTFVYTGGQLRTELVFVTIALFQALRLATVLFMPFAVQFITETNVTFKRMEVGRLYTCRNYTMLSNVSFGSY